MPQAATSRATAASLPPDLNALHDIILAEDRKLKRRVMESGSDPSDINERLSTYRLHCHDIIFQNYGFALEKEIDKTLWGVHSSVNIWYRKQLESFKKGKNKKRQVEARKMSKRFLEFIKTSQKYYREYIQELASTFGGIPELEAIAQRVSTEDLAQTRKQTLDLNLRPKVIVTCFETLIQLGDLSRWREQGHVPAEANWGPAIGFYDLASALHPSSGKPQHQLAVIAAASNSGRLRIVYHFSLSIGAIEPHPHALSNLNIEFKKILSSDKKARTTKKAPDPDTHQCLMDLSELFVILHAEVSKFQSLQEYQEAESHFLQNLRAGMKDVAAGPILSKIILIGLCGEYAALERSQASPKDTRLARTRALITQLNLKTFLALQELLKSELKENIEGQNARNSASQITPLMLRILPGLRLLSAWLLYSLENLLSARLVGISDEFWTSYAMMLSSLLSIFPINELPIMDYLLEEDKVTVGLAPFQHQRLQERFRNDGIWKPNPDNGHKQREHPNQEMLGRIRDLLKDGVSISRIETSPIKVMALENGTAGFVHVPPVDSKSLRDQASPTAQQSVQSDSSASTSVATSPTTSDAPIPKVYNLEINTEQVSSNMEFDRMVNDLVSDDLMTSFHDGSYTIRSPTPPSYSFEDPHFDNLFAGPVEGPDATPFGPNEPSSIAYTDTPFIARGNLFFGGRL